jgi:hypothetical protein
MEKALMKYRDLIQFGPITSVVKLVESSETEVAESLIKQYVFSQKIKEDIREIIVKNISVTPSGETLGIQIVGSYGTGKSHLMAVIACIAENESLLRHLQDDGVREDFKKFAGQYKVLRFEIGTDKPLKDVVFAHIERFLETLGIQFKFDETSNFPWKVLLQQMMAEFEEVFPDKHLLIVIDELLEYLKGRSPIALSNDLMMLRQMGEICDNSRFKLMFGVQELLYRSPEFQHASEMMNKVEDRYSDLLITKEDVSFVVKERLLKKNEHQKAIVREHLSGFSHLFEDMQNRFNEYVELFPVHPRYIHHFERVKHGKSQREILKVLSINFEAIIDTDAPSRTPGLITYDSYWKELSSSMNTIPDIRKVKDISETIHEKINAYFTGARSNKKPVATAIADALCLSILCDDLNKKNGASPKSLCDDLCITLPGVDDGDLLLANVETIAKQLVTATSGSYIDVNDQTHEFYIRVEGGRNFDQDIKDYAEQVLSRDPGRSDAFFFDVMQHIVLLNQYAYRPGFKIFEHSLNWLDKKSYRLGYIFFGNPNERSTTEPIQEYYIFFCPIFSKTSINEVADEVYFDMSDLSDEVKNAIRLFGAAKALEGPAPSHQKSTFRDKLDILLKRATTLLETEYLEKTNVIYNGQCKPLKSFSLPAEGSTKEQIFSNVAARLLNTHFNEKHPHYPAFKDLNRPISKDNFDGMIKNALTRIVKPGQANRDGEAILSGLGLWAGTKVDIQNSRFAQGILEKLAEKGDGVVLNRDEILYCHYAPHNLWYSSDYHLEHQLEFVVLVALVFTGKIEITITSTRMINALTIDEALKVDGNDMFCFANVKSSKKIPGEAIRTLFESLGLPDLTVELEKGETYIQIATKAKEMVDRTVKAKTLAATGIKCRNIALIPEEQVLAHQSALERLSTTLDQIQPYNTIGKLKNFPFSSDSLKEIFSAYQLCPQIEQLHDRSQKFSKLVTYLVQARSFLASEEQPLIDDIQNAIAQLPQKLSSSDKTEITRYETTLKAIIDRYADCYLANYTRFRLSRESALQKEKIMTSDTKRICDIIRDADFLSASEYPKWLEIITTLKEGDETVTKDRVKEEPYHDFNPKDHAGKPIYRMADLEEQLQIILDKWIKAMRSIFKDPSVADNLDLLNAEDQALVESFRNGTCDLTVANAPKLRNLIATLSKGIEKVELTAETITSIFSKPLTPNEAISAITDWINTLCEGKERSKIRMVLKG